MNLGIPQSWPRWLRTVLAWVVGFSSVLALIIVLGLLMSRAGLDSCGQAQATDGPWICSTTARASLGVGLLLVLLPLVRWWSRLLMRFASSESDSASGPSMKRGAKDIFYAVLLIPPLLVFVGYALIKGLAYWRNPALLGASPVAVALNLIQIGLMLIAAYITLRRLIVLFGRHKSLNENSWWFPAQASAPMSIEDQLRAAATGADRKPWLGVAFVAVLFAIPVLMVALSNGGSLAAAPMHQLAALALIELVMAAVVVKILIRVRRIRRDGTVDRPRE